MLNRSANLFIDECDPPPSTASSSVAAPPVVGHDDRAVAIADTVERHAGEAESEAAPRRQGRSARARRTTRPDLPRVRPTRQQPRRAALAAAGVLAGLIFAAGLTSLTRSAGSSHANGALRTAPVAVSPARVSPAARARRAPAPRRSAPPARRVKRERDRTPTPARRHGPARRTVRHSPSAAVQAPASVRSVSPVASSAAPASAGAEFSIER